MPSRTKRPSNLILTALSEFPKTVKEISRELDIPTSTIYWHLRQLLANELVKRERGVYSLTLDGREFISVLDD